MRVIIIDNPSESILRILLAGGVVSRTSLSLSVPSIDKQDRGTPAIEPPYIPTSEELEAAANADIETLDVTTPVRRHGVPENPLGVQATFKREWAKVVESGANTVQSFKLLTEVQRQVNAAGFNHSYGSVQRQCSALRAKMGIKSIGYGTWEVTPSIDKQTSICE